MICIYDPQDMTYEGYGAGILHPQKCVVHEVAGGTYELEMIMPIAIDDKWLLIRMDAVVRAPVPCVATPMLQLLDPSEGTEVYKVIWGWQPTESSPMVLSVRAQPSNDAAKLCDLSMGVEVISTGETVPEGNTYWMRIITPDGVCGWVLRWFLEYVRDYEAEQTSSETVAPRQIRDQLFRIYAISHAEDGKSLTARARHISYDLLYNAVAGVVMDIPTPATTASNRLMDALENQDHGFRVLTDLTRTVTGTWRCVNGVSMLLDPEHGLASLLRARVVRDNYDIFLLDNTPDEGGLVIRYGKNLIGVGLDMSSDAVYTRFVPLGKDAEGNTLRLPEGYIDSPRLGEHPFPRHFMWEVSGAQIGGKVAQKDGSTVTLDEEGVYERLREAANEKIAEGEDELQCNVQVIFIDLGRTVEYANLCVLQTVSLYDWVTVLHGPHAIRVRMQVSSYYYDCLAQRYTGLTLGDVFADRTAGVI